MQSLPRIQNLDPSSWFSARWCTSMSVLASYATTLGMFKATRCVGPVFWQVVLPLLAYMVWQGHIPRRQRKTSSGGQKGRFIDILLLDHETTKSWPQLISRHVWVYLGPRNPGSDSLAPQRWSRPKNLQLDISTILPRRRPAIPHSSVAATINQVTSEFHSHWESRDHPAGRSLIWFSYTGG